jgi:hypothetical protein
MTMATAFINELQSAYSISKKGNDTVYHNTKLLLDLYSKVLWRVEQSLDDLDEECYESDKKHLCDLINSLIEVDTQIDKTRFERRMQSIEESKSLIELIDKAVMMLKAYPENGERYYEILSKSYHINSEHKYSEDELLEELCISRTTLYREKRKAVATLGVILWGFVLPDFLQVIKKHETEVVLN